MENFGENENGIINNNDITKKKLIKNLLLFNWYKILLN